MKAQVLNGILVGAGDSEGTPAEGFYTLVGELSSTHQNTFEIIGDELHITGTVETLADIAAGWQASGKDYKWTRERVKAKVNEIGYANLSNGDRRIAAEWFVLPVEQLDQVLTLEEKIKAGKPFNLNSIASREARLEAAMRYARNVVPYEALIQLSMELDQYGLEQLYVKKGLEGTMQVNYEGRPDSTGLFDYLFGTGGFTGAGLPSKNIAFLHGLTLADVTQKLSDILVHGNY